MTIETFSMWSVMALSSDAAVWFRDAADLGGELRRAFGEELIQLLDGNTRALAEAADARRLPVAQVRIAHESHDLPVPLGQLGDAVVASDLGCDLLVPLGRIGEESLGVDVDGRAGDGGGGHASSFARVWS